MTADIGTIRAWLAERYGPLESCEPIAADASVRRFFRLRMAERGPAVAMIDATGGAPAIERMAAAARRLGGLGVRVPAVLQADPEAGTILLEDLGDALLADVADRLDAPALEGAYREAGRHAGRLARAGAPGSDDPLGEPRLGFERLRSELAFFVVHDVVRRRGRTDIGALQRLGRALDGLTRGCCESEPRLAHRDFHARNLLLLEDGGVGVVDFQDALAAPPHYDLVSLVWDPYVAVPAAAVKAALEGYGEATGEPPPDLDEPAVARVALQRLLKAIGTYARQALDLGRARFEAHIPEAEARLRDRLGHLPSAEAVELRSALAEAGLDVR